MLRYSDFLVCFFFWHRERGMVPRLDLQYNQWLWYPKVTYILKALKFYTFTN